MRYSIGIDNGLNGGIVVLDDRSRVVDKTPMPVIGTKQKDYDKNTIIQFLYYYKNSDVYLEKAQPYHRDGKKQSFKTGFGYGVIQGILTAMGLPFEVVGAKQWQRFVFNGVKKDDTKTASIMFCKNKWPEVDWTPTERSAKPHDGMTDAACIAYYGCH